MPNPPKSLRKPNPARSRCVLTPFLMLLLAAWFSPLANLGQAQEPTQTTNANSKPAQATQTALAAQPTQAPVINGDQAADSLNLPSLPEVLSPADVEAATRRWNDEIAKLERLDRLEPDPENAVLLIGSSSIRLWTDAAEAMRPYPVIRRGYGGARYSDLAVFAKRLITPHRYDAVVIFVANDIAGSDQDREVDQVEPLVRYITNVARNHQPEASIFLVEVTPTPRRYAVWPKIRELNAMLREVALTEPNVYFVATAESYLDADDQPLPDLFRDDRLHQNDRGYEIWADLIKRKLNDVLK